MDTAAKYRIDLSHTMNTAAGSIEDHRVRVARESIGCVGLARAFLLSVGIILSVIAVAKFVTLHGGVGSQFDPLFTFLPSASVLLLVAGIELAIVAFLLLKSCSLSLKLLLVAGFSMLLVAYRLGLWASGYTVAGNCGCLGFLTEWLGLSPARADRIAVFVLAYLMIGSSALLTLVGAVAGPARDRFHETATQ